MTNLTLRPFTEVKKGWVAAPFLPGGRVFSLEVEGGVQRMGGGIPFLGGKEGGRENLPSTQRVIRGKGNHVPPLPGG